MLIKSSDLYQTRDNVAQEPENQNTLPRGRVFLD
jgi:hypothetical protein